MSYVEPTLDEQALDLFPLDGPYSADMTRAAGRTIAGLVRYLCHATYSRSATPYPSTVDSVVHSLASAAAGGEQLMRQLSEQLDAHLATGRAYDDRRGGRDPADVVAVARGQMADAGLWLGTAAAALSAAGAATNHVGLDDEPEG